MNMEQLQPNMAVEIPGQISGDRIIDDLLNRIADRLERTGDLRPTDCYNGYAARVRIDLQLADIYPAEVSTEIAMGTLDAKRPSLTITLGADVAGEADDSRSLEKPIDPQGFTPQKRIYVSRIRSAGK
jgi:hypothetical protein